MTLFGPPYVKWMKLIRDVKDLIRALNCKAEGGPTEWKVHREAAVALGELGDVRAVEPLIRILNRDVWDPCAAAARALG
jgi:HEAT repeat protein